MGAPTKTLIAKVFEPIDQFTDGALRQWGRAMAMLDLVSPDCRPSFSKITTLLVLGVSVYTGKFGLTIAIAVLAAAFGRSTFMAFLNRHSSMETVLSSTSITGDAASMIRAARERRDPALGIDPAP